MSAKSTARYHQGWSPKASDASRPTDTAMAVPIPVANQLLLPTRLGRFTQHSVATGGVAVNA